MNTFEERLSKATEYFNYARKYEAYSEKLVEEAANFFAKDYEDWCNIYNAILRR